VIGWLVVVVLVVTGALAVYGIGITVAGRPPGRPMRFAVGGTVALLVVQAVIAAVRLFSGVTLPESSTFLIYLVVSVLVLPIALQFATASDESEGPSRWGGLVVAVAAVATAVAVLRLQGLWAAGGV
jgi:cell division protein FtsW (lipid II flippase)